MENVKIVGDSRKVFEELMLRAFESEVKAKELLHKLDSMGFFQTPASIDHHGDYEGGLFDHCWQVTHCLLELTNGMNLKWQRPGSPIIIGMFHDLCKVTNYAKKDVRIPTLGGVVHKPGPWGKVEVDVWGPGHGSKSVAIASTLFQLTEEEALCIRYHMGAYETNEWSNWHAAIRMYPNVLWTHTADMMASKIHGI